MLNNMMNIQNYKYLDSEICSTKYPHDEITKKYPASEI